MLLGLSTEEKFYHLLEVKINNFDLRLILFIIGIYAVYSCLAWLLDYHLSYKLNRNYDLSNQSSKEWLIDKVKMFILSSLLLYLIGRGFLTSVTWLGDKWWLLFTIGGILFVVVLNFLFPVVIFPLFFNLTSYPDSPLRKRLMDLFRRANIPVEDIYEFDLSSKMNAANAAVMGMGQTRKIILGDNLKERYSNAEIEAVLAHEIGHHVRNDIFKLLFIQAGGLLVMTLGVVTFFPSLTKWLGYNQVYSIVSLPLFFILIGLLNWSLSPIELFINRQLEKKADKYALELIDDPEKLATAFAKLADESLSELEFGWYKLLFEASHPPIGERVERALNWKE
ncbi:M48 family metallopeptidase [Halanaerocella petrolearia]